VSGGVCSPQLATSPGVQAECSTHWATVSTHVWLQHVHAHAPAFLLIVWSCQCPLSAFLADSLLRVFHGLTVVGLMGWCACGGTIHSLHCRRHRACGSSTVPMLLRAASPVGEGFPSKHCAVFIAQCKLGKLVCCRNTRPASVAFQACCACPTIPAHAMRQCLAVPWIWYLGFKLVGSQTTQHGVCFASFCQCLATCLCPACLAKDVPCVHNALHLADTCYPAFLIDVILTAGLARVPTMAHFPCTLACCRCGVWRPY
jgi:hypothetical protein